MKITKDTESGLPELMIVFDKDNNNFYLRHEVGRTIDHIELDESVKIVTPLQAKIVANSMNHHPTHWIEVGGGVPVRY